MILAPCTLAHLDAIRPAIPVTAWPVLSLYLTRGPALAGILDDGAVLGAGGIAVAYRGVGDAWLVTSQLARTQPMLYARTIRRILAVLTETLEIRRLQAVVDARLQVNIQFLEWLGFTQEGLMRAAGFQGQDLFLYSRVRSGHERV